MRSGISILLLFLAVVCFGLSGYFIAISMWAMEVPDTGWENETPLGWALIVAPAALGLALGILGVYLCFRRIPPN